MIPDEENTNPNIEEDEPGYVYAEIPDPTTEKISFKFFPPRQLTPEEMNPRYYVYACMDDGSIPPRTEEMTKEEALQLLADLEAKINKPGTRMVAIGDELILVDSLVRVCLGQIISGKFLRRREEVEE